MGVVHAPHQPCGNLGRARDRVNAETVREQPALQAESEIQASAFESNIMPAACQAPSGGRSAAKPLPAPAFAQPSPTEPPPKGASPSLLSIPAVKPPCAARRPSGILPAHARSEPIADAQGLAAARPSRAPRYG